MVWGTGCGRSPNVWIASGSCDFNGVLQLQIAWTVTTDTLLPVLSETTPRPVTCTAESLSLPDRAWLRRAALVFVLIAGATGELFAATSDLPFLAANYSELDPNFTKTNASTVRRRVLRFNMPSDFSLDYINYDPEFGGTAGLAWPTGRATTTTEPRPNNPSSIVEGDVLVDASVSVVVLSYYEQTLTEALTDSFVTVPMSGPVNDITMSYTIEGGTGAGNVITLRGKAARGSDYDLSPIGPNGRQNAIAWSRYHIVLHWGTGILGDPKMLLIELEAGAGAFTDDSAVLPLATVSSRLLGNASPLSYCDGVINQFQAQPLTLRGAIPDLLVGYDFSGSNTVLPEFTVPLAAVFPDEDDSYAHAFRYINQYDSGVDEGLPVRGINFPSAGGNACGPTALRTLLYTYGAEHDARTVFANTMEKGLVFANVDNSFAWRTARDWMEGKRTAAPPYATQAGLPTDEHAYEIPGLTTASEIAANWSRIDALLVNQQQPVLLRTDLSSRRNGLRGGGHVITLLGKSFSDAVREAFNLSGEYYIVADPGGHYFADTNGYHYKRVTELMAQATGINYGGWFAIYPVEWLRDSIRMNGQPILRALTFGVDFPTLRVDARSPVAVMVIDPLGRRTGLEQNGTIIREIPDSWFSFAPGDEESTEDTDGSSVVFTNDVKTVLINNPVNGDYRVEVTGTGNGSFIIDWNEFAASGGAASQSTTNTINVGQSRNYSFSYGPALPKLQVQQFGQTVQLSWPTNAGGFTLEATTHLVSPQWQAVNDMPVTHDGRNVVTLNVSGPARFFRLLR